MCYHRSCIVTEDERVLFHPTSDHHTDIRKEYGIREEGFYHTQEHVALECVPVDDLFDLGGWNIRVDQPTTPGWLDDKLRDKVKQKLALEMKMRANVAARMYVSNDELGLPYLRRLQSGSTLRAEGTMILGGQQQPIVDSLFVARRIIIERNEGTRMWAEPPFKDCTFVCHRLEMKVNVSWLESHNDVVIAGQSRRRNDYEKLYQRYSNSPVMVAGIDPALGPDMAASMHAIQHFTL